MESKAASPRKVFWLYKRMLLEKINQNWKQCLRVSKRFVFIRRIRFFFRQRYLDEPGSIVSPIKNPV